MIKRREDIDNLLVNARFDLTDEEYEKFSIDYDVYLDMIKVFDNFEFCHIEEARGPFIHPINDSSLRDDEIIINKNSNVLNLASNSEEDFILLEEK